MLGPIGKWGKSALERRGFEINRPTHHERELMTSYWDEWLSLRPLRFAEVYQKNRQTLAHFPRWVDPATLPGSLWWYGVGPEWLDCEQGSNHTALNEIDNEVSYSDLIGLMASTLDDLRYLEIGVSVGKNFMQIVELFPDATIFGLDVERPNPIIAADYETIFQAPTPTLVDTRAGEKASIYLMHHRLREGVTYVQGDQFAAETWSSMRGQKFNFIFSDGVHSGKAVRDELKHLIANDLIAPDHFIMYWDDLIDDEMQRAFRDNTDQLATMFPRSRRGLHRVHGSYGERRVNGWFEGLTNAAATSVDPLARRT